MAGIEDDDSEFEDENGVIANQTKRDLIIEFNGATIEVPVGEAMYFDSPYGDMEIIISDCDDYCCPEDVIH